MRIRIWLVALAFAQALSSSSILAADRPNIVLMLSDDQGWSGLSAPMHPQLPGSRSDVCQTPHLERIAAQGMRFSAAYAPAPVCSPTRISLQTGKSPAALHWTKAAPPELGRKLLEPRLAKNIDAAETTVAELLRDAGYATAHYGKWHIGGGGPGRHGYSEHDGDTGNEHAFQFHDPNPVDIFGMADRASAFMEKNAKTKRPFFIQLSWNALHASENARKTTIAKYQRLMPGESSKRVTTAAIAEDLDAGVGQVVQAIDRLGLTDSTYVIYMSDNGAGGDKRLLNGGKGGVWEGGIRIPFIVRGPGVPPNSWSGERVVGYDLAPTFCEWAGIPPSALPKGFEGGSIAGLLRNQGRGAVRRPRDELVFHFPHYQGEPPHSAILLGDFKLIHFYEDNRDLLFNLPQDIGERRDLASNRPADVKRLRERLDRYLVAVGAQVPTSNPDYDSKTPAPTSERPRRGKAKAPAQGDKTGKGKGRNLLSKPKT